MGCIGSPEVGGWPMTNDRPRSSRPLTQRSQSWVQDQLGWDGLPQVRSSNSWCLGVWCLIGSGVLGWSMLVFWTCHVSKLSQSQPCDTSLFGFWNSIQKIERLCVCSFLVTFVTATVLVSLRGHSASHFSVALVALRLTCLSIWQALGAQQRIRLAGGTTTTPGALEQTLWTFLGIFLESVVLLFACELRHESIFTTTFPSIWLYLTTNPAR